MRVLVATDFSEAADEALRQAHALVKARSGVLRAVHVLPYAPPVHALAPQQYGREIENLVALTPKVATALRDRVRSVLGPETEDVETVVVEGEPYAEIVNQAESWNADRVVVGGIGRTGLSRLLLGSVAERVVRYAGCSVLVARPSAPGAVLVATDLSEASLPTIEAGASEAAWRKSQLLVLYASEVFTEYLSGASALFGLATPQPPPEVIEQRHAAARQILQDSLARLNANGEIVVVEEAPDQAILRRAETLPAELVIVGTRGRTGLRRVTLGSVAERVVRAAHCSVFVAKLPHAADTSAR